MSLFVMQGVSKRYGGVRALQDARLASEAGRIHAVLGENGAGKSTLIKIMAGVVAPDEGTMLLDARPVAFASPAAANDAGIVCIFQELSLVPDLSVADNIAIRNPPRRFGLIDRRAQRRMAEEALARAGADDIHPLARVKDLSLSRLEVRGFGWTHRLRDISLRLHAGEVVGLGGLDGQGQRELLLALFGVLRGTTGQVLVDGRPVDIGGPVRAKRHDIGMALIPEDR